MIQYPISIDGTVSAGSGRNEKWRSGVASFDPLEISIPREFEGPNTGFSPEDLFALAMLNCFTATFKVVAEKGRLNYEKISGNVHCEISRSEIESGMVRVTELRISIRLDGIDDREKAQRLLEATSHSSILINSLKVNAKFNFEIN